MAWIAGQICPERSLKGVMDSISQDGRFVLWAVHTNHPGLKWAGHMPAEKEWCIVYVDAGVEVERLAHTIAEALGGSCDRHSVTAGEVELDVRSNDDFDAKARLVRPDGFLHFRYRAEIDYPSSKIEEVRSLVSRLLTYLWENEIPAVAACDFEEELPHSGGGQSPASIPWPK